MLKDSDNMGKVIKIDTRVYNKNFLKDLEDIREAYLTGIFDKIFILAQGEEKACTSEGINVGEAKLMCLDFILNAEEYID